MNNVQMSSYAATNAYEAQKTWSKKTDTVAKKADVTVKNAKFDQADKSGKTSQADAMQNIMAKYNTKYGNTIGEVELSETAEKYYEKLKAKFGNMEFVLVSKDMKDQVKAQASRFGNANKMVVLIDDEKLEKMATDESYRNKYEGIIASASPQMQSLKNSLTATGAKVTAFGMQVNDNGQAEYFAVVDKSLAAQRDRIEKAAEKKAEAKKAAKKAAAKEAKEEAIEEKRAEAAKNRGDKQVGSNKDVSETDTIVVTANTVDELIQKVQDTVYADMSDNVLTEAEKNVGQHFDLKF